MKGKTQGHSRGDKGLTWNSHRLLGRPLLLANLPIEQKGPNSSYDSRIGC